ncbi:F-box domain-containing protein [Colletotrichum salicis]|uniref:F-box domain-containing protein n=1 Tax=Colletotrichum salicis TaxID=1209931 RepID=A0A135UJ29_9PEZI|nr:F-box domain-containing protein [Colletotrichum salicis]
MDVAEESGDTATEAVVSFRACLVTLPPELLIEVIKFAMLSKSRRGVYFENRNTLRAISRVCKLLRVFTISFLFKTVRRTINEDKIHAQLQAIKENALILVFFPLIWLYVLTSLKLPVSVYPRPRVDSQEVARSLRSIHKPCSRATAALLVKVLRKMTPEEARITFQCGNKSMVAHFRAELVKQKACLQSVRSLTYPSSVTINFIPQTFPNLRYLSLNIDGSPMHTDGLRVIAPKLQTLATL